MTADPPAGPEQRRRRLLVVTRRRATALLGAVTVVFVVVTVVGGRSAWAAYVQATAEASMVGGLADWFAVTALFRRPLGLPIPHTAIIAERKEQFGATLGEFVQQSFLTADVLVERVRNADPVSRLGRWLCEPANAERVADQLVDGLGVVTEWVGDDEIGAAIEGLVLRRLGQPPLAPLASRVGRRLADQGRDAQAVEWALAAVSGYLDSHRQELHQRFAAKSKWWVPEAVEVRVFDRLLDAALRVLVDTDHRLRDDLLASIDRFLADLACSPELLDRGERIKAELLARPEIHRWAASVWPEVKAQAMGQDDLRRWLVASVARAAQRLQTDDDLRARLEKMTVDAVTYVADHFKDEIALLVTSTIARWDAEETSRRLELLLGPDLQYIRINGTVVGAAAGLALHGLAQLLR